MLSSGMNLVTTIIGFGMSATFIVFVCTRLLCRRHREDESTPTFEIQSGADLHLAARQVMRGLEANVVAAIPTMKFDREAFSSIEDAQCSICLGDYEEKQVLRIMPKCGHNFHLNCIDTWLGKQSTCPVCRLSLQDTFEPKHSTIVITATTQSFRASREWLLPGTTQQLSHSGQQETIHL